MRTSGLPPSNSWKLTKDAWDRIEIADYLHCVDKLRAIMRTLDERTKDQREKQLSTLQRDTWADLLQSLLNWHEQIGEGVAKYGVIGAGSFIAKQQAISDWMTDLRNVLDIDFEAAMDFVKAKHPGRGVFEQDEQYPAATAARRKYVTTVKDLPDFAARKAIAELYKAMKDPETQQFGREMLYKADETKDDRFEAWQNYAEKRWDEIWGLDEY